MRIEIKSYKVVISNIKWGSYGTNAWIMLFDAETAGASNYRVRLNFRSAHENYDVTEQGNFITVGMSYNSFPGIVDILRNEKPIFVSWYPDSNFACVATTLEPMGEEESGD